MCSLYNYTKKEGENRKQKMIEREKRPENISKKIRKKGEEL